MLFRSDGSHCLALIICVMTTAATCDRMMLTMMHQAKRKRRKNGRRRIKERSLIFATLFAQTARKKRNKKGKYYLSYKKWGQKRQQIGISIMIQKLLLLAQSVQRKKLQQRMERMNGKEDGMQCSIQEAPDVFGWAAGMKMNQEMNPAWIWDRIIIVIHPLLAIFLTIIDWFPDDRLVRSDEDEVSAQMRRA